MLSLSLSMYEKGTISFHRPATVDGMALHRLVAACPPLDANSAYCNLLQCTHFSATSILARRGDELVGAISGYLLPDDPDTLFVWQVAVADSARGQGLASRMLLELLARPACQQVRFLHTSVTPENTASRALFAALARRLSAPISEQQWFARDRDFEGEHADEMLLAIGPFSHQR
ncbi:MAG TPA: diaminobutyrate acetyltransferase [Spongiibacteraceae bacterium]|nr:diaminobutyrate acetyltransferase [Spongiibacteraceae bacterium]